MKLLLVNYEYPPIGAGAATAAQQMARAFLRQGHRPVVLTSQFGDLRGTVDEAGVTVVRLASRRARREASSVREMASFLAAALPVVRGLVRREGIDGIIAFFSIPGGPVAWWAARGGVPYVVSLRGGDVPGTEPQLRTIHALLTPVRRVVLRGAVAVVANSAGLRALAEAGDPVRVQVIPNGVDTTFFSPGTAPAAGSAFRWLFVGRFQRQKNLAWLLRQFAALPGAGTLDLVGDGPMRAELEGLGWELGIAGRLRWHGWLDRGALRSVYREADALLNPSLYEGMPNVVLEGMASGLPVLASRVAGNDAVVEDGVTGRLFGLGDDAGFLRAAGEWLADPGIARRLGQAGRRRAEQEFSWDRVASDYLKLFLPSLRPESS